MHHVVSKFFRFSGRAARPEYWALTILVFVPGTISFALDRLLPPFNPGPAVRTTLWVFSVLIVLSTLAGVITVAVRRAHDRGKSGRWVLLFYGLPFGVVFFEGFTQTRIAGPLGFLVTAVTLFWGLIELGFFPGTGGPNEYGPDPRTPTASAIEAAIARLFFPLLATIGVSAALGFAVVGREDIATPAAFVMWLAIGAYYTREVVHLLRTHDHPFRLRPAASGLAISLRAVATAALIIGVGVSVMASTVYTLASPRDAFAHQVMDRIAFCFWTVLPALFLWLVARLLLRRERTWFYDAVLFLLGATLLGAGVATVLAIRSILARPTGGTFLLYNWTLFWAFVAFFAGLGLLAHIILSRRARSNSAHARMPRAARLSLFVPRGVFLILFVLLPLVAARSFLIHPSYLQRGYVSDITPGSYFFTARYAYGYSRHSLPFAPTVFTGRVFYHPPQRGDVALVRLEGGLDLVARVMGLPGEKIGRHGRIVYVDGQPLPQAAISLMLSPSMKGYRETLPNGVTYTIYGPPEFDGQVYERVIPSGYVLLMNDARQSGEEPAIGTLVPFENLLGRVVFTLGQPASFNADKLAPLLEKVPDQSDPAPTAARAEPLPSKTEPTNPIIVDCNSDENARKLSGCSALISQGQLPPIALAVAHSRRSDAQLEAGNLDEAIADRAKALEFQPEDAGYKMRLAEAYVLRAATWPLQGKADAALRDYTEAIRVLPTNHEAYIGRSSIHLLKEDYDSAIADLRTAMKHHEAGKDAYRSALSRIYERRGEVQLLKKDFDHAITSLTESIGLASPQRAPYKQRAHAYVQNGQTELALKDYSEAIRFNPEDLDAYVGRGEIYRAQRMFPLALQDFDKVLSTQPSNVMARMLRALTREEAKDRDGAIADYQAVLKFEPKHGLAKAGIERLRAYVASTVADDSATKSESLAAPKRKATNETEPRAKQGCFVFNGKKFCN